MIGEQISRLINLPYHNYCETKLSSHVSLIKTKAVKISTKLLEISITLSYVNLIGAPKIETRVKPIMRETLIKINENLMDQFAVSLSGVVGTRFQQRLIWLRQTTRIRGDLKVIWLCSKSHNSNSPLSLSQLTTQISPREFLLTNCY